MRILVADDDSELCALIGDVLSALGCEVVCVSSLESALRLLKEEKFDCCVLDLVFEGEGVLDIYSLDKLAKGVRVVVLTGVRNLDRDKIPSSVEIVNKPARISDILAAIWEEKWTQ